jgi:hypothetical protein
MSTEAEVLNKSEIEQYFEKYEREVLKLGPLQGMDVPPCLNMSSSELRKRTPEDLACDTLDASRYEMYINRLMLQQKAWEIWAKAKIDQIVGLEIEDTDPDLGWINRALVVKSNNPVCKTLMSFLIRVQMTIQRYSDLTFSIRNVTQQINNIRFANSNRIKKEGYHE